MKNPCLRCDCYNPDYEGCEMPSYDRIYACPLEAEEIEKDAAKEETDSQS